jgi:ankyrin repeat domain-containing protein 50
MLRSIDESSIEKARRILTLLCFSSRPLMVQELIDGIAVDLHEPACLNLRRRLQDADDLHEICPGLIDVDVKRDDETQFESDGGNDIEGKTPTVRIAHFSVQEYLESDRIKLHRFALESASAHAEIAQICLVYLQEPGLSSRTLDQTKLEEFPLAHFAAMFWYHHYKNATGATSRLDGLILRLFQQQDSFYTWVKLQNPDRPWVTRVDLSLDSSHIASPVYYASLLGFDIVLHELISICQEHASEERDLINAQDGTYDNALQAASKKGHDKVVQILIDAGADVNTQTKQYDNALQAASYQGYDKIGQMLINAGANVNQSGKYDNALLTASEKGYDKIVQMLIDAGADVNIRGKLYGNALQAASYRGYDKVVQMLMDAGADVNQGGLYGSALQAASQRGYDKVMQMLIDAGADVNAQSGRYGNAPQAASHRGHDKVVQMLIDAGADVNAQGGQFNNALQAASKKGYNRIIQMLIDAGADVNAQGGR